MKRPIITENTSASKLIRLINESAKYSRTKEPEFFRLILISHIRDITEQDLKLSIDEAIDNVRKRAEDYRASESMLRIWQEMAPLVLLYNNHAFYRKAARELLLKHVKNDKTFKPLNIAGPKRYLYEILDPSCMNYKFINRINYKLEDKFYTADESGKLVETLGSK